MQLNALFINSFFFIKKSKKLIKPIRSYKMPASCYHQPDIFLHFLEETLD